ncbi:hypothetical protein RND71_019728 [Anisodus tanguticus]|uniref:Uncharacterized protein n=1 Tax=Anisodus tanguticus TaxID=243964 RepID=A0AAE1VEL3_9SOLA|nr:hypothetical protein RND71_019728 [Anisodus tanguticus]
MALVTPLLSEEHEDFNCKQGKPKASPILTQISTIYTHKIYNIIEKEFLKGTGTCFVETQICCDGEDAAFDLDMNETNGSFSTLLQSVENTTHVFYQYFLV